MIMNDKAFNHDGLEAFWSSGGKGAAGVPPDQAKRIKKILVHLHTARSLNDIAEGLGRLREFHKLKGHRCRYALSVSGNDRITFDCPDPSTGIVTNIVLEDYH